MFLNAIMVLALVVSAVLSFFAFDSSSSIREMSVEERTMYLDEWEAAMREWYGTHINQIDSIDGQVLPPPVDGRWGATVLASKRIACNPDVMAHRYALVIPGVNGTETTMEIASGIVSPGKLDMTRTVDGCEIAADLFEESRRKASWTAGALENYFKSNALKEQYGSAKNYFMGASCNGWGDMPCTTGADISALIPILGMSASDCRDAYGNPMLFDNSSTSVSAMSRPYTSRVGFTTPWGITVWATAIEKGY